ncbi:MAG: HIT family protein [Aquificaceae bacterium]|nr:MAG: HIT family protein [Aquificaceae bacterium]
MKITKNSVYENSFVRIEVEENEIPWLKIFTKEETKEFSQCKPAVRQHIWQLLDLIEREMIDYYQPEKINIASFANYLPQVHWHIMARFKEDSYFPECVWGQRQREANLDLPALDDFIARLQKKLAEV